MEFTENMVGKIVREFDTGDEGVVLHKQDTTGYYYNGDHRVMVEWYTGDDAGKCFHIDLSGVEFIDNFTKEPLPKPEPEYDIIEVAGVKYKLVPV